MRRLAILIVLLLTCSGCSSLQGQIDQARDKLKADASDLIEQIKGAATAAAAAAIERAREEIPLAAAAALDKAAEKAPAIMAALIRGAKDEAIAAAKGVVADARDAAVGALVGVKDAAVESLEATADAKIKALRDAGIDPELLARLEQAPTLPDIVEAIKEGKEGGLPTSELIIGLIVLIGGAEGRKWLRDRKAANGGAA